MSKKSMRELAKGNCQLTNQFNILLDQPEAVVDCAQLVVPNGTTEKDLLKEKAALERANEQLRLIDKRRAY